MADHASPSVYTVMQELEWGGNREGQTALCLAAQMGQQEAVALVRCQTLQMGVKWIPTYATQIAALLGALPVRGLLSISLWSML